MNFEQRDKQSLTSVKLQKTAPRATTPDTPKQILEYLFLTAISSRIFLRGLGLDFPRGSQTLTQILFRKTHATTPAIHTAATRTMEDDPLCGFDFSDEEESSAQKDRQAKLNQSEEAFQTERKGWRPVCQTKQVPRLYHEAQE